MPPVSNKPVSKPAAPAPTPAAAPVVAAPAQKGGKKVAATPTPVAAAPAPVVAAPATPVAAQKGGAKKAAVPPTTTPAAAAPAPKKAAAPKKAPVVEGGAKKAATKGATTPKKAAAPKKDAKADDAEEEGEDDPKGVRSFKVQLPGTEEYSGRFTGLTPYQAANKALSKFFRENKTVKTDITFSIRESTRGSKRTTYTYNGKREKLNVPVKYSIKSADGVAREIVKEYKNKLTKVKKADVVVAAPVAA
jgi:hypothetical protein